MKTLNAAGEPEQPRPVPAWTGQIEFTPARCPDTGVWAWAGCRCPRCRPDLHISWMSPANAPAAGIMTLPPDRWAPWPMTTNTTATMALSSWTMLDAGNRSNNPP